VMELIDQDTKRWNLCLIKEIFREEEGSCYLHNSVKPCAN
jgi:hypothetical protein